MNQKYVLLPFILVICAILIIACSSPELLSICFIIANLIGLALSIVYNNSLRITGPKTNIFVAFIFFIVWFGVIAYFFRFYPLFNFIEPLIRILSVLGVMIFTFIMFSLILVFLPKGVFEAHK
ncbi:MAG: hypothetical protein RBQ94_04470 [Methanimicrococcus sp.]|nr:hypothetical protein [Methanimicrococcus sp.]